jgi:hypothetical protein
MKSCFAFLLSAGFVFSVLIGPLRAASTNSAAADSMERKLQHVEQNAAAPHPDTTPTEFTEQEVNAYIAAGRVKLPAGVQSVSFEAQPDLIIATSRVDFDQLKKGQHSSNPLLSVFSGVHNVDVQAHAHGVGHKGYVDVQSVALDGVEIPHFVLQLFVEKYLQPKYPGIGLNSQFTLPDKVDTAKVGQHRLTITQK